MKYVFLIVMVVAVTLTAGCYDDPDKHPEWYTRDCGGTQYNYRFQTCCGSTLYNNTGTGLTCCGEKQFLWLRNDDQLSCCSNDPKWYLGLQGTVGEIYSEKSQHCCNGIVVSGGGDWADCGNSCYEYDSQSCCNGQLYQGRNRCCNPETSPICSEGMRCCNDKIKGPTCYNPDTEYCHHFT